ncbi:hypothetical protein U9M48_028216 [Paspalum notatum var. saurae]|uniref:Peroxidase n=1 Tax=Paspalum notatum var. saurae TaxID=547442 RepID=A0AAQ3TWD0_PASNO
MGNMSRYTLLFVFVLLAATSQLGTVDALIVDGLEVGFYGRTCPEAEGVIRDIVNNEVGMDHSIAPGLIRLFFHDCFITGCDASILLDESPAGDVPEKESSANGFTLVGLRTIDIAKSTLEAMCPRIVSCADILAFAARDAAVAAGLPSYDVAAGRRDGMRSNMDDLPGNFPVPGHHVPRLTELFNQRGLSQEDLVVLSGAHSIGGAHCFMFSNRIYGFSKEADIDPSMDPIYAAQLRQMCPPQKPDDNPEQAPKVKFDAQTEEKLDSAYYSELLAKRGLLTSDSALIEDPQTRAMVETFARDDALWQQKFAEAMQKVGMLDVLIGNAKGQVRKQCRLVNGQEQQQKPQLPWFRQQHRPPLPWLQQRHLRRPLPRHPVADLINGFFRGSSGSGAKFLSQGSKAQQCPLQ